MENKSFQDRKLREKNRELDFLRREEEQPVIFGANYVNTNIDMSTIDEALNDIIEQEIENYEQLNEVHPEEIKEYEDSIEIQSILDFIDSMEEEEREEFFNSVPECLKNNHRYE